MGWQLLIVFIHMMAAIVWFGYVLFWAIITGPVAEKQGPRGAARVLALVNRAAWPPRQIPLPFRLTLSQVGWGLLALLALTGVLLLPHKGVAFGDLFTGAAFAGRFGGLLAAKLVLVAALGALQLRLALRPTRGIAYANLAGAVLVAGFSVYLAR